jgi:DNA-binding Lrp family transcriptional regulator
MAHLGPTTASEIGELLGLPASEIEKALLRIEASGAILRGKFRPNSVFVRRQSKANLKPSGASGVCWLAFIG